ncbi:MAG: hypothetical protein QOG98_912 [Pseudonocardiales bacterium]|nr:hypothetical protein [Pseudonocardiales bacterium]
MTTRENQHPGRPRTVESLCTDRSTAAWADCCGAMCSVEAPTTYKSFLHHPEIDRSAQWASSRPSSTAHEEGPCMMIAVCEARNPLRGMV